MVGAKRAKAVCVSDGEYSDKKMEGRVGDASAQSVCVVCEMLWGINSMCVLYLRANNPTNPPTHPPPAPFLSLTFIVHRHWVSAGVTDDTRNREKRVKGPAESFPRVAPVHGALHGDAQRAAIGAAAFAVRAEASARLSEGEDGTVAGLDDGRDAEAADLFMVLCVCVCVCVWWWRGGGSSCHFTTRTVATRCTGRPTAGPTYHGLLSSRIDVATVLLSPHLTIQVHTYIHPEHMYTRPCGAPQNTYVVPRGRVDVVLGKHDRVGEVVCALPRLHAPPHVVVPPPGEGLFRRRRQLLEVPAARRRGRAEEGGGEEQRERAR